MNVSVNYSATCWPLYSDPMEIFSKIKDFLKTCKFDKEKPLLVLLGPTAAGKTALSLTLAKEFNGEIISADSRQVYKHMDIGTDKILMEKREGIPHYLLDLVEPSERFTVADFKKLAEEKIEGILARGNLPMIVGGTGLYIRSVTENFAIPPENPEIRRKLLEELADCSVDALYKKLQRLDPKSAAKIHPKNIRYIIRALEIVMSTGAPKPDLRESPKWRVLQIGLSPQREILFERIHRRIDEQMERGLVDETKKLLEMGYAKNLPSMSSLGYREMIQYLEGAISLEEAVELLKKNTQNFAKRQMVWFKRDREVVWIQS